MSVTIQLHSGAETLQADLYGDLPARRAVILVHGKDWDASGWRDIAPRFVARGVPALAINLRGKGGSTGHVEEFAPPKPWTPALDRVKPAGRAPLETVKVYGAVPPVAVSVWL